MERRKPGRKSKGPRKALRPRLPEPLYEAVHNLAQQRGMTVNDLIGEHLADLTGVPYATQEGLPLTKAS